MMRLALASGRTDWRRLSREMTWPDLVDWVAFSHDEPFGQPAVRAAQARLEHKLTAWFATVVQAMYNLWGRRKGQPPYEREKFELTWTEPSAAPARRQTVAEQKSILMAIARAHAEE